MSIPRTWNFMRVMSYWCFAAGVDKKLVFTPAWRAACCSAARKPGGPLPVQLTVTRVGTCQVRVIILLLVLFRLRQLLRKAPIRSGGVQSSSVESAGSEPGAFWSRTFILPLLLLRR